MPNEIEYNFTNTQLNLIQSGSSPYTFDAETGDNINVVVYDVHNVVKGSFNSNVDDFQIYRDASDDIYIKPNELLQSNEFPEGNYKVEINFFRDFWDSYTYDGQELDRHFIVTEISPSRKEIRLRAKFILDEEDNILDDYLFTNSFQTDLISTLGNFSNSDYKFDYLLSSDDETQLPIINYAFDSVSNPDFVSLIIRLSKPITFLNNYDRVSIKKELIDTQTLDFYYFSDIPPVTDIPISLDVNTSDYDIIGEPESDTFQNYDQVSSTGSLLSDSSIENFLLSGSDYKNLNIDYNTFENHTFFGSAKEKLYNFKQKVGKLEGYYSQVSQSLQYSASQVTVTGTYKYEDSTKSPRHIINKRNELFDKIQEEINSFTPYERFLYYDGQSQTTASAPSLGPNYATTPALYNRRTSDGAGGYRPDSLEILTDWDGLGTVYKLRQTGSLSLEGTVYLDAATAGGGIETSTPGKYMANHKPFYGYSGSVWFSFLARMDGQVSSSDGRRLSYPQNRNYYAGWNDNPIIPANAFYQSASVWPLLSSGSWQRHICRVSQSYWRPHSGVDYNTQNMVADDFTSSGEGTSYIILSSSEQIFSASTDNYPPIKLHGDYISLGTTITGSGDSFSGSITPSHTLFNVHMVSASGPGEGTEPTSSYISDFKVTFNDPTETHPFSTMYQTGSTVWDSWYNGMYDSASAWDDNNIHSLQNNLPKTLRIRDDSDELKKFLNMWGEQFDLIRNYIDNYSSFHKRGYKLKNSVPPNLIPIIADSLGWELIAPFTGSLTQFFGGSESEIHGDITTTETVTHNTWRKIINNLVYLYKSKGTLNSVDSMLNIYGYPSEVINLVEYGGSSDEHNPSIITNDAKNILKAGLRGQSGSVSFVESTDILHSYLFNKDRRRALKFDWWMNDAKNLDTVEFIIKPQKSSFTQDLLINSGSTSESLWDLRLKSVTNSSSYGQLEFRLSDEQHSTSSLTNQAVSMSTDTLSFKDGRYWNVMLQRMTSSISGTGIQEYRLSTGTKDYYDYQSNRTSGDFIKNFTIISMSVSGGTTANAGYYANQNWESTGSLTSQGNNLYVGTNYTGSLAEFRAWKIPLSASKFKQHILNYRSVVGHHISSSQYDLIYHYPMNENWSISSSDGPRTNPKIYDSNPRNIKDYSISIPSASFLSSSGVYTQDIVSNVQLSSRTIGNNQGTDNKILINPPRKMIGNLDPKRRNERDIYSDLSLGRNKRPQRIATTLVEIGASPQDKINNFILNHLPDFDITQYFADPQDLYEDKYIDLVKLRDDLYRRYDISLDVNKWIRAQERLLPKSLIEGLKKLLPAKSTMNSVGVLLKPTILDRDKVEYKRSSLETDRPKKLNIHITTSSISLSDSSYETIKKAQVSRSLQASSTYESIRDDNIDMIDSTYQVLSSKPSIYDDSISITSQSYALESSKPSIYDDSISITSQSYALESSNPNSYDKSIGITSQSYTLESSKTSIYNKTFEITKDSYDISSLKQEIYNKTFEITKDSYLISSSKPTIHNINFEITKDSYDISSSLWIPYTGSSITNISDMGQKSYYNPNDDWGRTKNDLHFVSFAGNTGSDGYYNNTHYETRYHFYMIGDVEEISSSFSAGAIGLSSFGNTYRIYKPYYVDPTQIKNFKNRQVVDKGKGFTYTSYISGSGPTNIKGVSVGNQDGKAMGKTGFFATSSAGRIYYPSNHYINFQDTFLNTLIGGTQFQGGYFFQCPVEDGWIDLSQDAFYTVNVTGDNELRVHFGKDTIDPDTNTAKSLGGRY